MVVANLFLRRQDQKVFNQALDELTDIVIDQNREVKTEERLDLEKFYTWINDDVQFLRRHSECMTDEILSGYRSLLTLPTENKEISKASYMEELFKVEKKAFGKDTRLGEKGERCFFNWDTLGERLEYLGFDILAFQSDPFWSTLYETVITLNEHPFYGDEYALISLFEVAVEYALQRAVFGSLEDFQKSVVYRTLSQRREDAECEAIDKMNSAYKLANLTEILDDLEKSLKSETSAEPAIDDLKMTEEGRRIKFENKKGQPASQN